MFERTLSSIVSHCLIESLDCSSLSDDETSCKSLLKMPRRFFVAQQVQCLQQHWLVARVWAMHVRM